MRTICRLLGTMIALVSVAATAQADGQPREQLRGEAVSLSAYVGVRSPAYTSPHPEGTTVFAPGEVRLTVALGNYTNTSLQIGSAARHWAQDIAISVLQERGSARQLVASREDSTFAAVALLLKPNEATRMQLTIRETDGSALKPGTYKVSVSLPDRVLPPSQRTTRNLLSQQLIVEIREASTPDETADLYLQRAYAAFSAGRLAESRQWAEKVLAINSQSIVALLDVGESFLREGNCARALPMYAQAIRLLETGADPLVRLQRRDDYAQVLRKVVASKCER